ncbi:PHP domain-containing protein [bacterium]|nr:MAG: PHP domain-containing protein [bacterium]
MRGSFLTSIGIVLLCVAQFGQAQEFEVPRTQGMHWFKGNTHAHTTMSDGDSSPEEVARWYKTHGYQFLVLSDHNTFTDPIALAGLVDSSFLLIPGEELTSSFQKKPVHVNGLNIHGVIPPQKDSSLLGTIQRNIDAVRSVEGVPHINHPNFGWAIDQETLLQVRNNNLLEIFNGHPLVHNQGGSGHPGMEEVWDYLLTSGMRIYGIAVDDAHHFKEEFGPKRSNPGKGWVVVRASKRDPNEIIRNLEAGFFYSSTGVELEDVQISSKRMEIRIRQKSDFGYRTEFIGSGGRVLLQTEDNPAVFELKHQEAYVRARVSDSGGFVAWVQPVFVRMK